jgi:hypothetical protein
MFAKLILLDPYHHQQVISFNAFFVVGLSNFGIRTFIFCEMKEE